jgi:superfamily II DNA or RNA helicase
MRHIYIYETKASSVNGLIKIGDANDVESRIQEQLNTASATQADNLQYRLLYQCSAVKDDGAEFRDHDIHAILINKGYHRHQIASGNDLLKTNTEWFKVSPEKAIHVIDRYRKGDRPEQIDIERFHDFSMRPEQKYAVDKTAAHFKRAGQSTDAIEMLWNAKMRFGKTFAAYQLALKLGLAKVLVLTYKPAVQDAWQKDLENHVDFSDYVFLKRDSLNHITEYTQQSQFIVAFASYQDLLGTKDDETDIKDKHKGLFATHWDLVIIDEFHYGTGTRKAKDMLADQVDSKKEQKELEKELFAEEDEEAREEQTSEEIAAVVEKSVTSDYRLFLSGTPFRAMADARFDQDAIFNWTYTDEQKAKAEWAAKHPNEPESNPYRSLPQIQMYLYKVSDDLLKEGIQEGKDEFSLNHFLKAKKRQFLKPDAVNKWLDLISGRIRPHVEVADELVDEVKLQSSEYPYDPTGALHGQLDHTLWYLNRVDSAYAMKEALESHPIFSQYHIILAAGKELKSGVDAVQPVLDAIDRNNKTITLSVGKLTTGVSIPKWKAVLFLRDTESPENYFQTAFRAQTPYKDPLTGAIKERCFIFDFSPNRSLKLLTSYSEKLSTDSHLSTSEQKISEFLRYLPVLKVTGNQMVSMDAREVLTFDLSGIDAKGLGERFVERKNVVVTRDTIEAINASEQSAERCQEIFNKIKKFKKFIGATDNDIKNSDVDVGTLDVNNGKIKKLETKEPKNDQESKQKEKDLDDAERELKSEREKVRELLKTLLSRIPVFMYLTDATEENLEQVLVETDHGLFRKATGITTDDFRYLRDLGLIRVDSIDGYILKFLQLENQNYELTNSMVNN